MWGWGATPGLRRCDGEADGEADDAQGASSGGGRVSNSAPAFLCGCGRAGVAVTDGCFLWFPVVGPTVFKD